MPATILYLNAVGGISGAERSLLTLLQALDRDRWTPVVAAPDGPLLAEAARLGAATMPVPLAPLRRPHTPAEAWTLLGELRAGWRAVRAAVRATQPALLHANTTPAMLYALRAGVPCVWQVRDLTPLGRLGTLLYRRAAGVAAISDAVRADLLPYADDGGAKIRLLPPAVDTAHFTPVPDPMAIRRALGLPTDRPLIGLVAQFAPWKRHHLFLDALARLPDLPWHAVLAGAMPPVPSEETAAYIAGVRARLEAPPFAGRVTLLPWQEDAAPLLAALDVLALTSAREPFGRVLIEAMACGVPVVAVAEGGPCEIIDDGYTGLLTPADPTDIAGALSRLLTDTPTRTAMGAAAREQVVSRFSLARHTEQIEALYASIFSIKQH